MQEQLLGYMLGALEDDESREVEEALQRDPRLQEDLSRWEASVRPLEADRQMLDPPPGLAERTCQDVAERAASGGPAVDSTLGGSVAAAVAAKGPEGDTNAMLNTPRSLTPVAEGPVASSRWSLSDLSVAGGVFLAAGLLLLPAIEHSRFLAQRTTCQNNLRQIGQAALQYSEANHGYFPQIDERGNLSVAGVFPVRLIDGGFLEDASSLVCPTSVRASRGSPLKVPTLDQLRAERNTRQLHTWYRTMGGDYAYTLGQMNGDAYEGARNHGRSSFPIVADAPIIQNRIIVAPDAPPIQLAGNRSGNHGGHGQNVLNEDGSVEWKTECTSHGDNFYTNDENVVAAGRHPDDAVCGRSDVQPMPKYLLSFPR